MCRSLKKFCLYYIHGYRSESFIDLVGLIQSESVDEGRLLCQLRAHVN